VSSIVHHDIVHASARCVNRSHEVVNGQREGTWYCI
jgi:hypothetical protein